MIKGERIKRQRLTLRLRMRLRLRMKGRRRDRGSRGQRGLKSKEQGAREVHEKLIWRILNQET